MVTIKSCIGKIDKKIGRTTNQINANKSGQSGDLEGNFTKYVSKITSKH